MNKIYFYILNVLAIAVPLAFFEIIVEKKSGWGSSWQKNKWYAKAFAPKSAFMKFIAKALDIEPPLNYHVLMFLLVIPVIFLFEYFYIKKNILLLLASFSGALVTEDFLWFLFNWYFDSLHQLLKGPNGTIFWHKRWFKISGSSGKDKYLPASYFSAMAISLLLLLFSLRFGS